MKTIKIVVLAVITVVMASCGSSKKAVDVYPDKETTPQRVKIASEECEEEAMAAKDFLRGYGVGTSQDKMFARDQATANARNEIVNQVEVCASNMIERYASQHQTSGEEGLSRDEVGRVKQMARSIAEQTLKGARIICSNTYMTEVEYEVHVCVELTGEDFATTISQKVTNDDKLMIDYEAEKFKDDFNSELEKYRKSQRGE